MRLRPCALLAALLALVPLSVPAAPPAQDAPLAARALAVLEKHCSACHGQNGPAKGGFGYVLDRDRLIAREMLLPGKPNESELFRRVETGEMPPPARKDRPSKDEVELLRQWIAAGAPPAVEPAARAEFVDQLALLRRIRADLETFEPRHRRFYRYLTLTHLANAGAPATDLEQSRRALGKLVNSLSWHPRVTLPVAVDAEKTIYRIDLRVYKWTAAQWDRLVSAYPYRLARDSAESKALASMTASELPHLRGDWFVATASRPPHYYDLLQMPSTDRGLERLLQVDVPAGIQEETAVRAGFNDSGVSKNNRLLERHDATYGAYWRSYDFDGNAGRKSIFDHPLGPANGETSFAHAGGEMIFHLPNGLHGYLLTDAAGRRIDKGPSEIVADPKRPDQRVEAGISCMSCHAQGLIFKADQVRAHVEKNRQAFAKGDLDAVRALYAPKARLQAILDDDNKRYLAALKKTGTVPEEPEEVNAVTQRHEGTLDLPIAAAELGLKPAQLEQALREVRELARPLGALAVRGGTVQRQVFEQSFAEAVRLLRLDDPPGGAVVAKQPGPAGFSGHTGWVTAIAFASDGRRVATGGADKTVRVWNYPSGEEMARCEGHTAEVTCVAFSPDGKSVLSGGADRTLRLWDAATGKLIRTTRGHTAPVRCVAFAAEGGQFAAGDDDRAVRVWDVESGRELRSLAGHTGPVRSLAFGPAGLLVSGSHDGTVRVWDDGGKQALSLVGHTSQVYAVAVSPDGKQILSGGNDRTVRLWSADGKAVRTFEGHATAVNQVAFAPDGKYVLSGSSQYQTNDRVVRVWDRASGRQVRALSPSGAGGVGYVAFAPDGRSAAAGGERSWSVLKWDE